MASRWTLASCARLAAPALLAALPAGSALAREDAPFAFTPQPRWRAEPETAALCAAIAAECAAMVKDGEIQARVDYDELYDARGMLAGLRLTKSTGCQPLDESALLGQRKFRLTFHHDDEPDLEGVHAEVAPGTDPAGVRIVKASGTTISLGC